MIFSSTGGEIVPVFKKSKTIEQVQRKFSQRLKPPNLQELEVAGISL